MQPLTPEGRKAVLDIAGRYSVSTEAVEHMLSAVNNGSGQMAQFNCPELGGSGQWMRGGMVMVGDMFNHGLKSTVDSLCNELSNLLSNTKVFSDVAVDVPRGNSWWPEGLGSPFSSGSQNNARYALFAGRLAVELDGKVSVHDTLDHRITGVSQQQGSGNTLTFSSQHGTVDVSSLPVVSGVGNSTLPETRFASTSVSVSATTGTPTQNAASAEPGESSPDLGSASAVSSVQSKQDESGSEIIMLIEKLAQLHTAGVLSEEEFSAKKRELLARL